MKQIKLNKYEPTIPECVICGNKKLRTYRNSAKIIINRCDKCDSEMTNNKNEQTKKMEEI